MSRRATRIVFSNVWIQTVLFSSVAYADTSGQILLRGVVPPRAEIGLSPLAMAAEGLIMPGAPVYTVVETSPSSSVGGGAVLHLNRFTNSSSGVVVKIAADSAGADSLAMIAPDGSRIPYKVRFAQKDVEFEGGEAELATVTRNTQDDEASGRFEIIAPAAFPRGRDFTDHIVLIIAAR